MTAYSTQGSKVSIAQQSAFGTPATTGFKDVRLEGNPSFKTPVGEGTVPQEVFTNQNDVAKPIVLKKADDGAVTLTTLLRQAATPGDDSIAAQLFTAGGYQVKSNDDTTIATYTDTTDFTLTDAVTPGTFVNIELDDGSYCPTLVLDTGSTDTTPIMALPSATSAGKNANKMFTISSGQVGQIGDTSLLTVKATVKAQDGGNDVVLTAQDGALTGLADLNLEPGALVTLEATIGASDVTDSTGTLGTNDFSDGEKHVPFNCPLFQFASYSASGGITASYAKLLKATFTWGVTAEQIQGAGDTSCVNNIQGWMQKVEPCKLVIEMLYDSDKLDEFTTSGNDDKYIGIIQKGSSETDPAFALVIPKAHQSEAPTIDTWGNNEHRVTVTYTGRTPQLASSSDTADTQLNQPWYFGIADRSS
jgi:hypothetical protein